MTTPEELRKKLRALRGRTPADKPAQLPEDLADIRRKLHKDRRAGPPDPQTAQDAPTSQDPAGSTLSPIVYRRDLPQAVRQIPSSIAPPGKHVVLEQAVSGRVLQGESGAIFLVERRLRDLGPRQQHLCDGFIQVVEDRHAGIWEQIERAGVRGYLRPEELLLVDIETTGLGSSPLFLIGAMVWEDGGLVARQYLARDYSEERPAVARFLDLARTRSLLISFNGKSFDLPYIRMRAAANALACEVDLPHLDLLHAARRAFKGRLPDCKLQTLERHLCGRHRRDDTPGHLIPDAYHEFVRTGNAALMVDVLEHNFLDLVTLAEIMLRIPKADWFGME